MGYIYLRAFVFFHTFCCSHDYSSGLGHSSLIETDSCDNGCSKFRNSRPVTESESAVLRGDKQVPARSRRLGIKRTWAASCCNLGDNPHTCVEKRKSGIVNNARCFRTLESRAVASTGTQVNFGFDNCDELKRKKSRHEGHGGCIGRHRKKLSRIKEIRDNDGNCYRDHDAGKVSPNEPQDVCGAHNPYVHSEHPLNTYHTLCTPASTTYSTPLCCRQEFGVQSCEGIRICPRTMRGRCTATDLRVSSSKGQSKVPVKGKTVFSSSSTSCLESSVHRNVRNGEAICINLNSQNQRDDCERPFKILDIDPATIKAEGGSVQGGIVININLSLGVQCSNQREDGKAAYVSPIPGSVHKEESSMQESSVDEPCSDIDDISDGCQEGDDGVSKCSRPEDQQNTTENAGEVSDIDLCVAPKDMENVSERDNQKISAPTYDNPEKCPDSGAVDMEEVRETRTFQKKLPFSIFFCRTLLKELLMLLIPEPTISPTPATTFNLNSATSSSAHTPISGSEPAANPSSNPNNASSVVASTDCWAHERDIAISKESTIEIICGFVNDCLIGEFRGGPSEKKCSIYIEPLIEHLKEYCPVAKVKGTEPSDIPEPNLQMPLPDNSAEYVKNRYIQPILKCYVSTLIFKRFITLNKFVSRNTENTYSFSVINPSALSTHVVDLYNDINKLIALCTLSPSDLGDLIGIEIEKIQNTVVREAFIGRHMRIFGQYPLSACTKRKCVIRKC